MTMDIAMLGIGIDARPVKEADKALDGFEKKAKDAEKAADKLTDSGSFLTRMFKDLAKALATFKILDMVRDAVMLAARFETLGVVMNVAGNNAGYTRKQMADFEKQLQATGISMTKSREALASLATANIDLSKASALARASQDLAVVAGINSSDALLRMVHGIKSGETEVLKTMGLNVQWERGYAKLAQQLHKNKDALTEHEKTISRTNTVLVESKKYQGIYEESMTTAGKAITSLTRYWEDLKVKAGEAALPALAIGVQRLTDALKGANAELDKAGNNGAIKAIGEGFGVAFLFVIGQISKRVAEVAYYIALAAREMAGFAAQATLLAKGDFKGFRFVSQQVSKENEAAEKALKAYKDSIDGVKGATDAATLAAEAKAKASRKAADERDAGAKAAKAAQDAKDAADEKAAKALEEATKQQKKYDEAYKDVRKSIHEKIAALKAEEEGQEDLTDGQKFAIKILDDLRTGELKLSEAKKIKLAVDLEALLAQEKATKLARALLAHEQQLAAERSRLRNADYDAAEEYMKEEERNRIATVHAAVEAVKAAQQEYDNYGKLRSEIALTTLARMQDKYARLDAESENALSLAREIEQQQQLIAILKKTEARDAQVGFWKSIEEAGHSAFMNLANGAKDVATRMRDYFKNIFFEWLYSMTLKKWLINIGATSTGMTSAAMGNAMGLGSGAGGSAVGAASLLQVGKGIYDGVSSGFAGVGEGVASGVSYVQTAMGTTYGTAAGSQQSMMLASQEAGMGASAGSAGSYAGSAATVAAGMIAGKIIGGAISGQYQIGNHGSAVTNAGTAIGTGVGYYVGGMAGAAVGAALGGAIGGALNRVFGMADKKATGTTLNGEFGANGLTGNSNTSWTQKGGWFRSDASGVETSPLDAKTIADFTAGYEEMKRVTKEFADTLMIDAGSLATRSQTLSIALTEDAAANQKAITDFFAGVGNTMASELLPGVTKFAFEGESAAATLQRLAGNYKAMDTIMMTLGQTSQQAFGSVGVASLEARERLIAAAGGLDALAAGTVYFAQNFLTEAERMAPIMQSVRASLDGMGLAAVDTNEEFKNAAMAIDKGTEAGAKQFAAMLLLAPQFKQMTDYTNSLTVAMEDNADIMREHAALQDRLDELLMTETQLKEKERNAYFESNRALLDYVNAAELAKTNAAELAAVVTAQADAAKAAAEQLASINAGYQQQINAFLPLAEQRRLEVAGMDASTLALYERLEVLKKNKAGEEAAVVAAAEKLAALKLAATAAMDVLTKSIEAQKAATKAAYDSQLAILNAQKSSAKELFEVNKAAAENTVQAERDKNDRIRALASSLQSAVDSMRLGSQLGGDRRQAQGQINSALAIARATGVLPTAESLKWALQTVAKPSEGLFSTFRDYQRDFQVTANSIRDLNDLAGGQLVTSDTALAAAQAQVGLLQSQYDAQQAAFAQQAVDAQAAYDNDIAQFDETLKTAHEQLDAALGTNVLLVDVKTALAGLTDAVRALKAVSGSAGAGGAILGTTTATGPTLTVNPNYVPSTAPYFGPYSADWYADYKEGTGGNSGQRALLRSDEAALSTSAGDWQTGSSGEEIRTYLASLVELAAQQLTESEAARIAAEKGATASGQTNTTLRRVTRGGNALLTEEA